MLFLPKIQSWLGATRTTARSVCSRWSALPDTTRFACAWTGGRDCMNRYTQLPQPTDVMQDQALLLPLIHRRCCPVFETLLGLQYLIDQQKQRVRHRNHRGGFLTAR